LSAPEAALALAFLDLVEHLGHGLRFTGVTHPQTAKPRCRSLRTSAGAIKPWSISHLTCASTTSLLGAGRVVAAKRAISLAVAPKMPSA
jgi:hypothetical protein